jgi:Tol biopolymer transport system component
MSSPRSLALLAAGALLALSSVACSDADSRPDKKPDTGGGPSAAGSPERTILFQRDGTKRTHLAWVDQDGTNEEGLLPDFGDGNQTNPEWSPDGTNVVFAMTDGTTDDLFVAVAGEAEATKLLDCIAPCLYLDDPSWAPDGERVVYSRTVDRDGVGVSTLESVDVTTGQIRVLLGPWTRHASAGARWSPDGRQIVFELLDKVGPSVDAELSGVTLTLLDQVDGTRPSTEGLTDPELFAATAYWSPDGRWIVYSALPAADADAPELFRINAVSGDPVRLTQVADLGGYAAEPTYSRDGEWIVFSGGRSSDEDGLLLRVHPDGTELGPATGDVEVHGRHPSLR